MSETIAIPPPVDRPTFPDGNMIDWPALFKQYVHVVGKNEGTAFLDDMKVTPEEDAALAVLFGRSDWRHLWWSWVEGGWRN